MRRLLLPVPSIKQNHVCQILHKVKENGSIFVSESNDDGWPGKVKADENDPMTWQVSAWTFDP